MSEWGLARLDEVAAVSKGRLLATSSARSESSVRYLGAADLEGGASGVYASARNAVISDYGDVLMLWDGERSGLVGYGLSGAVGSTVARIRPRGARIVSKYLYHQLRSRFAEIQSLRTGTGVPHVPRELQSLIWLPVPPRREQRRIAEILDAIDETVHATERIIAKLTVTRLGLMREQLAPGMSTSPPPGWEILSIEELLGNHGPAMRSGPFGSALLASELVEEGVPLLGIDNVQPERFVANYRRFVTPAKAYELRRYRVFPQDLMITIMGTVGRCCIVPETVGNALSSKHVWTLTLDPARYLPELACVQVNSSPWALAHFARDAQGGIMSAIRSETLCSLRLPTPPMAEQRRIWAVLKDAASEMEAHVAEATTLRQIRSGLATDLLSGRVRTVAT